MAECTCAFDPDGVLVPCAEAIELWNDVREADWLDHMWDSGFNRDDEVSLQRRAYEAHLVAPFVLEGYRLRQELRVTERSLTIQAETSFALDAENQRLRTALSEIAASARVATPNTPAHAIALHAKAALEAEL